MIKQFLCFNRAYRYNCDDFSSPRGRLNPPSNGFSCESDVTADGSRPSVLNLARQRSSGTVFMLQDNIDILDSGEADESENVNLPDGIDEILDCDSSTLQQKNASLAGDDDKLISDNLYKKEVVERSINKALTAGSWRRDALLLKLKGMGITAFVIDSQHAPTTVDVMGHVQRVISFVAGGYSYFAPPPFQRCLLFQNREGKLYNLVLPSRYSGIASKWHELQESFSAFQATLAFAILLKLFSWDRTIDQKKPLYLALILGLIMKEELSMSWTNATIMVRGFPSISACHTIGAAVGSDWIRKVTIGILALSGALVGRPREIFMDAGIIMACVVMFANLGSRTWFFFQWDPLRYNGPFASAVAYMAAVVTGFSVPFLGQRMASVGSKPAIESIIKHGVALAVCYIIADVAQVEKMLDGGETDCRNTAINIFIGIWFSLTLLVSLIIVGRVTPTREYPEEEHFLVEDQQSPVGFKVPIIPDITIEPNSAKNGMNVFQTDMELALGIVLACFVGISVPCLSFADWNESFQGSLWEDI